MKFKEFTNIIPGYSFRGAISPDSAGNTSLLQAKDINRDELYVQTSDLTKTNVYTVNKASYLQKNDVVLVSRGMKAGSFKAAVYDAQETNILATASIYIIRLNDAIALPEYIAQYLNSEIGQDALANIVSGSYIGLVSRQKLLDIDIPMVSLDQQRTIVQLYKNIQKQQEIVSRENEIKKQIINAVFRKVATV